MVKAFHFGDHMGLATFLFRIGAIHHDGDRHSRRMHMTGFYILEEAPPKDEDMEATERRLEEAKVVIIT